ncbi:Nop14-like protein [Thozetella sp. PMI_491]|nr:Nop14-like protein [Thozetella sp. PMI_491]
MAGSQLKRLKASLRDQGIIGPQQSKKQKKKNAQDLKARNEKRLQRSEALESIREQFNPFEFHMNARGPKFQVTTNKPASDKLVHGRPAVSKSRGEEKRRETLLVDLQRRRKVGGLIDRRFGEHDPTMGTEEKMTERFAQETIRNHKKHSVFDLEEEDPSEGLTHGGKPLFDGEDAQDDFEEDDLSSLDDDDPAKSERRALKRMRLEEDDAGSDGDGGDQPERKKTKSEVMQEVIAKSKEYKYLRQAAKEEDTELRSELDKELPELQALLLSQKPKPKDTKIGAMGGDKMTLDKDYDLSVKQLAADRRAQPTQRTKTEEEKAEEDANRLKELEAQRLKRMQGMESDGEDDEDDSKNEKDAKRPAFEIVREDEDQFKLGKGIKLRPTATELGFDDEDDFEIDDDLVASGSELDEDDLSEGSDEEDQAEEEEEEDDEFTKGLLTGSESKNILFQPPISSKGADDDGVPYAFEQCPQTHQDLLSCFKEIPLAKIPVAIQRIRAVYHPKLDSQNKERLGNFAKALVQHIAFLAESTEPQYSVIESVVRHVHSLSKTFPIEVAKEFRVQIEEQVQKAPLPLDAGWLVTLGAISTTFPTSDHWHQVVTPSALLVARSLQSVPQCLADYATSAYLSILVLQFQQLSKRYVPELMNACLNTFWALAPTSTQDTGGFFPTHEPLAGTRIKDARGAKVRRLGLGDCKPQGDAIMTPENVSSLKVSIIDTTASVLREAAELWSSKPAFFETFQPALRTLQFLQAKANRGHLPEALLAKLKDTTAFLQRLLKMAHLQRRPLELHHHKPLPIRTYIPKFEDSFDPNKHYDPDRDRAELAKLKAEHKRERKGAMRELRNDARFIQREQLRQKKVRDAAYEKKFKRIVAEIQNEEGAAANEYEREKKARKQGRRR